MRSDAVVGKAPRELTFSHKLFEGTHARDIVRPFCATSVTSADTLKVASLFEIVESDILMALIQEVSSLKEINDTSCHRDAVFEGLI